MSTSEDIDEDAPVDVIPPQKSRKTVAPEYCRVCASRTPAKQLRSFAAQSPAASSLLAMIHRVNTEVARSDGLPQDVCPSCIRRLKATKDFIEIVDAAQLKLKQLFASPGLRQSKKTFRKCKEIKVEVEVDSSSDEWSDDYYLRDTENRDLLTVKLEPPFIKNDDANDPHKPATSVNLSPQKCSTLLPSSMVMLPKYNNVPTMIKDRPTISADSLLPRWSNCWCCKRCEQRFDTIDKLRDHSIDAHTRCITFKCVSCPKRIFTYRHFFQHMAKHDPLLKQCCEFCDECFVSNSDARWHKEIDHEDIEKAHQCKNCGTFFDTEMQLRNHSESYTVIKAKTAGDRVFKCTQCPKVFPNKIGLQGHMENHDRSKHLCQICNKTFATKYVLSLHEQNVHNPQPQFICQTCGKCFKLKASLKAHIDVHNGLKPYPCDVCHKMFRTSKQVQSHKVSHGEIKNHVCKICSKGYKYHTGLRDHMRTHDNIRPYVCDICPKDFISWSNYNKHMKAIHNKNMAKSANERAN